MVVYSSVQYTTSGSLPYILLFTQALTHVWFDVTFIDINTILVDLSPTFYCLPKPLLVYSSMLLLSTLILSSYSIIVVMLGYDWGLRNTFKIPGSGFVFAAFEYPSMTNKEIIQYTIPGIVYYLPKPLFVYVLMVLLSRVGLYS